MSAPGLAAAAPPTASPQATKAQADQIAGNLQQCIEELAKVTPSIKDFFQLSVEDAATKLFAERPDVFSAYKQLLESAKNASALSDAAALQWKDRGNAELEAGNLDISIINYTKGTTLAETDEVLATLLNNRSTVFFRQQRFRDSCVDANTAVNLNRAYWKAVERRGRCLKELGHLEAAAVDIEAAEKQDAAACPTNTIEAVNALLAPRTTSTSLPLFPPTATVDSNIKVERDAKGRFVVAAKRLNPGQILSETPYAVAPKFEGLFTACSMCLKRTSILVPSEFFRRLKMKSRGLFCSSACDEMSWKLYGERESANVFFLLCPVDALLASRMVCTSFEAITVGPTVAPASSDTAAKESLRIDPLTDNKFGKSHINSLCTFSKEFVPFAETGGSESIVSVLALASGAVPATLVEPFRKAMRQILVNAMNVTCIDRVIPQSDSAGASHSFVAVTPGKAVYSVASLFNHSCDPNCFASFKGNPHGCLSQLSIRLIRPVMEGEELTIAYSNVDKTKVHSTRARIRALRNQFGFACTCNACRNNVDEVVTAADQEHYIKAADYYQKGRRLVREGDYETAINVLFQSYSIVMRDICPPPRPPQLMLPKTHDALAQAFLLNNQKDKCVEHLLAAMELQKVLNGGDVYADMIREYTRLAFLSKDPAPYVSECVRLLNLFYCESPHLEAEIVYIQQSLTAPTA